MMLVSFMASFSHLIDTLMKFNDLLNKYITEIGCTAKELSEVSGLSAAAMSRYRTGERVPGKEQLAMLIDGLVSLAEKNAHSEERQQKDTGVTGSEIREAFRAYTDEADFDYEQFTDNLNMLISALDISTSELSRALSFDPSYISRIRLGHRGSLRTVRGLSRVYADLS